MLIDPSKISIDAFIEKIKQQYPGLSDEEVRDIAEEAKKKASEGFSELGQEDLDRMAEEVKDARAAAAHGEDGFQLYSSIDAYGVLVMSMRDEKTCNPCLDHDGSVYTLDEAKEKDPIPHDACQNEECRCYYSPIIEKETYEKEKASEPDLSNLYD